MWLEVHATAADEVVNHRQLELRCRLVARLQLLVGRIKPVAGQQAVPGHRRVVVVYFLAVELVAQVLAADPGLEYATQGRGQVIVAAVFNPVFGVGPGIDPIVTDDVVADVLETLVHAVVESLPIPIGETAFLVSFDEAYDGLLHQM